MTDYGRQALERAIETLRETCDRAERYMADCESKSDVYVANTVMHEFVWGMANAYSSVEAAFANADRMNEMFEAKMMAKDNT